MTYLIGIGLDSMNRSLNRGMSLKCISLLLTEIYHLAHGARTAVSCDGYHSVAPHSHQWECESIVSGEDFETLRPLTEYLLYLIDIAASLLYGGDIGQFCQPECRVRSDVTSCPSRHVIDDQRDIDRFADGFEVKIDA